MAKTEPTGSLLVVCDAGPLIHLDEVGCADLLAEFPNVLVPEIVWREVMAHRPAVLARAEITHRRVVSAQPESPAVEALAQALSLHAGERQALSIALEHRADLFFTDDTAARLAAGNLGLRCHGTIGLLVRAIRQGQRSKEEALIALRALPQKSTLHLKRSLLDAVIAEVEQSG